MLLSTTFTVKYLYCSSVAASGAELDNLELHTNNRMSYLS